MLHPVFHLASPIRSILIRSCPRLFPLQVFEHGGRYHFLPGGFESLGWARQGGGAEPGPRPCGLSPICPPAGEKNGWLPGVHGAYVFFVGPAHQIRAPGGALDRADMRLGVQGASLFFLRVRRLSALRYFEGGASRGNFHPVSSCIISNWGTGGGQNYRQKKKGVRLLT